MVFLLTTRYLSASELFLLNPAVCKVLPPTFLWINPMLHRNNLLRDSPPAWSEHPARTNAELFHLKLFSLSDLLKMYKIFSVQF